MNSLQDLTVVIPVLNGSETISKALDSCITLRKYGASILVLDGQSSDNTIDIAENHPIEKKIIQRNDGGLYEALNYSLSVISTDFWLYLASDDIFINSSFFEEGVSYLKHNDNLVCVYGKTKMQNDFGSYSFRGKPFRSPIIFEMNAPLPSSIYRVSAIREIQGFNTRYSISADFDMHIRLIKNYNVGSYKYCDYDVVYFSLQGMSNINRRKALRQVDSIIKNNYGNLIHLMYRFYRTTIFLKYVIYKVSAFIYSIFK